MPVRNLIPEHCITDEAAVQMALDAIPRKIQPELIVNMMLNNIGVLMEKSSDHMEREIIKDQLHAICYKLDWMPKLKEECESVGCPMPSEFWTPQCRYHKDLEKVSVAIDGTTKWLAKAIPIEMITNVLLCQVYLNLLDFIEIDQWEVVKDFLITLRNEFEERGEPYWTNLIDDEVVARAYNKRYG